MEYKSKVTHSDLLVSLNNQRLEGQFCDVTLVVSDHVLLAHRCILAASSEYFRARFLGDLGDCNQEVCDMSPCTYHALEKVVNFIYTGHIAISLDTVEDILQAADYLCVAEIKSFCIDLLRRNLDVANCIQIKALSDQYSLLDIRDDVMDFLVPRMMGILSSPDVLDIPFSYIYSLLCDYQLNYICETSILEFIFRWINHLPDERFQYTPQLIACVEFAYLGSEYIKNNVANSKDILKILLPEQKKVVQTKMSQQQFPNRVDDVIICRSRCNGCHGDKGIELLVYLISEDKWYTLECPEPSLLDGLESMACDQGALYLLLSRTEDMCGYVHDAKVTKQLWKVSLNRGVWSEMKSPESLSGQSRLIPHVRGLYVVDRTGVIEKYDNVRNTWVNYSDPGFEECPNSTMYLLPMPMDRYIYILRGYSEGYSFDYARMTYALHRYDTERYTWTTINRIEPEEVELADHERFHGYTATTSSLVLKDAMGLARLKCDLVTGECTAINPDRNTPKFITEIWGCAEHIDRVYFTGRINHGAPTFMMYDHGRKRFKMVTSPPEHVSGLLNHVVVPRSFRDLLHRSIAVEEN